MYPEKVLSDLRFIEDCKSMHIPLDEIKRKIDLKSNTDMHTSEVKEQIDAVTKQMKQLHNEISVLLPLISRLDEQQKDDLSKRLNLEGSSLIKSLVSLTS